MTMPSSGRTIPELFSDALAQLAKLLQNEVDLARLEIADKASKAAGAIKLIGAGAIILIPALVLLLFSVAAELIVHGLSDPLAYLLTGGVAAIVAIGLVMLGAARLSPKEMTPNMTISQLKKDKHAAEEMVR
jgi:hypothetical protein